jgi:enoyl-CoA hydratase/carnithine racemase
VSEIVRFEIVDAVGVITLDRPPVNAIDGDLVAALGETLEAAADPAVRAVVVTGEPHFAAGADIKGFKADLDAGVNPGRVAEGLSQVLSGLESLPKPVFAAVKGFAIGGGLELALACDFRFLADDARVGQGEVLLGIFPGAGGTQRLPRLIGLGPARDLVYSGRQVGADEALALGLADAVHPADELLDATMESAARLAAGPTVAIGIAKRAINEGLGMPLAEGLALETEGFEAAFATEDAREGVSAFLEKRSPEFRGR